MQRSNELQKNGLLERRPRRGTTIASGYRPDADTGVRCLLVFLPEGRRVLQSSVVQELTDVLLDRFEGASIQLCPIPEQKSAAVVREMIRAAARGFDTPDTRARTVGGRALRSN